MTRREVAQIAIQTDARIGALLRGIVDAANASGVGIVRADAKGRILEANDAFYRIVGTEPSRLSEQRADWLAIEMDRLPYALRDGVSQVRMALMRSQVLRDATELDKLDGLFKMLRTRADGLRRQFKREADLEQLGLVERGLKAYGDGVSALRAAQARLEAA